jgi:pyruvate dehydrogenase E1 component alpha subunit
VIKEIYFKMVLAREVDLMAVSFQRQGRMYTYPPNLGQEAVSAALGHIIRENDWLVPAFRELGAWLAKGVTIKEVFLYFMGNESAQRFIGAPRMLPISVPIASQLPHALGIAKAMTLNKENSVVYTVIGDGGTSQGDFHEALNFAARYGPEPRIRRYRSIWR